MSKAAEKGLQFREQFKRGGTRIGVTRAHQLKNQEQLSYDVVQRMLRYFKRHEIDKEAKDFGNDDNPSAGYIAWLLWGGDPGYEWSKKKLQAEKD
ncbi:hypothetical protein ACNVED_15195 (plasmid) [Legionella sp. D16C41]|uniref:hypothetical protein n=1 Tax=Legionella sp. D16C41 TaxID=3402688 RepID=UPI003AF568BD